MVFWHLLLLSIPLVLFNLLILFPCNYLYYRSIRNKKIVVTVIVFLKLFYLSEVHHWQQVKVTFKQRVPPLISYLSKIPRGFENWKSHTNIHWTRQRPTLPGKLFLIYYEHYGSWRGNLITLYVMQMLRIKVMTSSGQKKKSSRDAFQSETTGFHFDGLEYSIFH